MKYIYLFPLLLILLVPTVQAFTFINIYIDETGEALFLGETDETPIIPSGVELDNGKINGFTSSLTSKQAEKWTFSYSLEGSEINLILPRGAVIKKLSNGEISLDGDQISIFFEDSIEVQYTVENVPGAPIPTANVPLIALLFAFLIILIVFLINYTKREKKEEERKDKEKKKRKKDKKDNLEIIKQVLSEREKLILNKLKETGKIKSSYLRKAVDIPKASFSRHVQELEKKGLIKRSGEGKNKFVELKK